MEKRVFLAIFLSFVVLAVYQSYFAPPPIKPAAAGQGTPPPSASPVESGAPAASAPGGSVGAAPSAQAPAAVPSAAPLVADAAARRIVVETEDVRAVFNTAGATLESWQLLKYLDETGQHPLELIPQDLPPAGSTPGMPRPFTLGTDDAAVTETLRTALFQPSADSLQLGSASGTLSFTYRDSSGLNARKTFYFQPDGHSYLLNVDASVDIGGTPRPVAIMWGPAVGSGYSLSDARHQPARAVQFRDGAIERLDAGDLTAQPRYEGVFRFAGVEEQYFLVAAVPGETTEKMRVEYEPVTLPVPGDATGRTRTFVSFFVSPAAAAGRPVALPFFVGPKDFDKLRAVETQLVRAIDFGMFAWLVVPLLQALKWLNGYLHNYGWSIIALTVLINLAIFPLRHRSMVSMRKMQSLQPEVKAIQERYAKYKFTDPERQKMNQEMMALYKQKGVNPASGCVPMLLTMPILFAFYAMLSVAIELRGAPFVGWIHDLASKDPYYVWPVLMGGTMFWQQKMMPTTADPMQQRIFLLMPVVFTVTFLGMPAGLVIYWLASNVMAIGQQYLTNRLIGAPVPVKPVVKPPAKPAPRPARKS